MADFVKAAATAKRLIEANGRSVTFFKLNRTAADPTKPWRGPTLDADPTSALEGSKVTAKAAFVPASGSGFGRDARDRTTAAQRQEGGAGGTLVRDIKQIALVAASSMPSGTDLELFDAMRDGDRVWKIQFANILAPATTDIIWEVGVGS